MANKYKVGRQHMGYEDIIYGRGHITNSHVVKGLQSAVWILRFPSYPFVLTRVTKELVIWLEALESIYQGLERVFRLPELHDSKRSSDYHFFSTISGMKGNEVDETEVDETGAGPCDEEAMRSLCSTWSNSFKQASNRTRSWFIWILYLWNLFSILLEI